MEARQHAGGLLGVERVAPPATSLGLPGVRHRVRDRQASTAFVAGRQSPAVPRGGYLGLHEDRLDGGAVGEHRQRTPSAR